MPWVRYTGLTMPLRVPVRTVRQDRGLAQPQAVAVGPPPARSPAKPHRAACLLALAVLAVSSAGMAAEARPPLRIAAAADLALAMKELVALHDRQARRAATVTLGSSGLLARQIDQGAPFDVFFSANVAFVDQLIAQQRGVAGSRALYARGRIVLWTRAGGIQPPDSLRDLDDARFKRIAIANPAHAPYGLAAQQALRKLGLWDTVRGRLVFGENVSQTLQFAQTGNAEVAIVALSLAIGTPDGSWALLDDQLHQPIDQGLMVVASSADLPGATAFAGLAAGPDGRAILQRYGFVLPGEVLDPALLEKARGRVAR